MNRSDLIENIKSALTEMPDSALARAHNEICSRDVELAGENQFIEARAFKLSEDEVEEAKEDPTRIIAKLRVQQADTRTGRIRHLRNEHWDVTRRVLSMDEEDIRDLVDADYSTDPIVADYSDHKGPHDVYVTDQIQQYWREVRGEPLWQ
jgi:protein-tyrosine-phosphatase